jgi:predicted nucleotide-binding protein
LAIDDEAGCLRATSELKNIARKALRTDVNALNEYLWQIEKVYFPKGASTTTVASGQWRAGCDKMVALVDAIEHSLQYVDESNDGVTSKQMNRVFIVHGQDHGMLRDVEAFVRRIDLDPVILMDEASRSNTVIEKVELYKEVPYAIILLSPDDIGKAFDAPDTAFKRRPRQNAVLEHGFFIGLLGRKNTVALVDASLTDNVEYPSDLGGVIPIYYRPDSDWQSKLLREFRASEIEYNREKA